MLSMLKANCHFHVLIEHWYLNAGVIEVILSVLLSFAAEKILYRRNIESAPCDDNNCALDFIILDVKKRNCNSEK